ncbi:MAG TPA: PQQ-binding-like beta-propeller repeat protein [Candidatus Acidoferrales bacterium]|nr:PQQ-binding-like beta-propeller repeat protein [Candidatus Acidoferrales bacterium]
MIIALSTGFYSRAIGAPQNAVPEIEPHSYRLEEKRVSVPAADVSVGVLWSRAANAPDLDTDQSPPYLAIGKGDVAFTSGGQVCGFRAVDGARQWCAGPGLAPVYGGGEVAFVRDDGRIVAADAKNGHILWSYNSSGSAGLHGNPLTPAFVAYSGIGTFLAAGVSIVELSKTGKVVWSTLPCPCSFELPVSVGPFTLQPVNGTGAYTQYRIYDYRLNGAARTVGEFGDAESVLKIQGQHFFGLSDIEPPARFLSADVFEADLASGKVIAYRHYEPDYDDNYARFLKTDSQNQVIPGIEGPYIYVPVQSRLYRYPIDKTSTTVPLEISDNDTFVGGPYQGSVYVARADGVWSLHPLEKDIEARLVAPSVKPFVTMTFSQNDGYVAFEDGRIEGFDVRDGRPTLDASAPCVPWKIIAAQTNVYLICNNRSKQIFGNRLSWRVVAFSRSR